MKLIHPIHLIIPAYLLVTATVFAQESLDVISNIGKVIQIEIDSRGSISVIDDSHFPNSPIKVKSLILDKGDLSLNFQIQDFDLEFEKYFIMHNLKLKEVTSKDLREFSDNLLESGQKLLIRDTLIQKGDGANKTVTWMGITEQIKRPLIGRFSLEIQSVGKGTLPINCKEDYSFVLEKQLPHYLAAAVGVSAFALSYVQKNAADDVYENQYLIRTIDDQKTEGIFNDANNKRHQYLIMKYGGLAVVSIDLIWYYIRSRNLKKKRDIKSRYCSSENSKVTLRPILSQGITGQGLPHLGLSVHFRLGR